MLTDTLKKHFGYDSFRPLQEEIVSHVLAGKDAFVLMPTGGGKSLCYQLPALVRPGITLVVSPLIALMKDQVDALTANGILAAFLNSTLEAEESSRIQAGLRKGEYKLLYVAPERLALQGFRNFLQSLEIGLIAIDEAHCISEWGHDFRPDYGNLRFLRQDFPDVPVIALTATATEVVRKDILAQLNLAGGRTFISSFNRPNLTYRVEPKRNTFAKLVELVRQYTDQPTIIYCFSRKDTEKLSADLREAGFSARPYHAGLSSDVRARTQEQFTRDEISIVVATIAFGMGIDKPDIRLVVHYALPKSVEGYYQETGRAGRDGLASECVLFYTPGDIQKHEFFLRDIEDNTEREQKRKNLRQMVDYSETRSCRRTFLLNYFGEPTEWQTCGGCDNCLTPPETEDATEVSQKILSAILRTGERFGIDHITKVLRGSRTERVLRQGHEALSVFGIASKISEQILKDRIRHLIAAGMLAKSSGEYPVLTITTQGKIFLKERGTILLPKIQTELRTRDQRREAVPHDPELFEQLRRERADIARELSVAPFIVFGDRTLIEMASLFPQTKETLARIFGVGAEKLERFGERFLAVIQDHAAEHNLEDAAASVRQPMGERPHPDRIVTLPSSSTFRETQRLLGEQYSITEIAQMRGVTTGTILGHMERLQDEGENLNLSYLPQPDPQRLQTIREAVEQIGSFERLAPIKEALGADYSYDELRLARIFTR